MNLHNDERPKMNGRPAWLSKRSVIPPLEFWMTENSEVEVRMFLPVTKETGHIRYHTIVHWGDVAQLLTNFDADPETTVLDLFKSYKELAPDLLERKPVVKHEPGVLIKRRARLD